MQANHATALRAEIARMGNAQEAHCEGTRALQLGTNPVEAADAIGIR
jgi:hypothetical protein